MGGVICQPSSLDWNAHQPWQRVRISLSINHCWASAGSQILLNTLKCLKDFWKSFNQFFQFFFSTIWLCFIHVIMAKIMWSVRGNWVSTFSSVQERKCRKTSEWAITGCLHIRSIHIWSCFNRELTKSSSNRPANTVPTCLHNDHCSLSKLLYSL